MAKAESKEIWILFLALLLTSRLTLAVQIEANPTAFSMQKVLPDTQRERLHYEDVLSEHIRTRTYVYTQKHGSFTQEASIQIQISCRGHRARR